MKKRIVSIFLALIMIITAIPAGAITAFAEYQYPNYFKNVEFMQWKTPGCETMLTWDDVKDPNSGRLASSYVVTVKELNQKCQIEELQYHTDTPEFDFAGTYLELNMGRKIEITLSAISPITGYSFSKKKFTHTFHADGYNEGIRNIKWVAPDYHNYPTVLTFDPVTDIKGNSNITYDIYIKKLSLNTNLQSSSYNKYEITWDSSKLNKEPRIDLTEALRDTQKIYEIQIEARVKGLYPVAYKKITSFPDVAEFSNKHLDRPENVKWENNTVTFDGVKNAKYYEVTVQAKSAYNYSKSVAQLNKLPIDPIYNDIEKMNYTFTTTSTSVDVNFDRFWEGVNWSATVKAYGDKNLIPSRSSNESSNYAVGTTTYGWISDDGVLHWYPVPGLGTAYGDLSKNDYYDIYLFENKIKTINANDKLELDLTKYYDAYVKPGYNPGAPLKIYISPHGYSEEGERYYEEHWSWYMDDYALLHFDCDQIKNEFLQIGDKDNRLTAGNISFTPDESGVCEINEYIWTDLDNDQVIDNSTKLEPSKVYKVEVICSETAIANGLYTPVDKVITPKGLEYAGSKRITSGDNNGKYIMTFYVTTDCLHNWELIKKEEYCTKQGTAYYACTECGKIKDPVTIEPAGHVFNNYFYEDDCHYTWCSRCDGYFSNMENPRPGREEHTFVNNTCTVCGFNNTCSYETDAFQYHDDFGHWYECSTHIGAEHYCPNHMILDYEKHTPLYDTDENYDGEWFECANEYSQFYDCQNGYMCSVCGENYGEKGKHIWTEDESASSEPTCDEPGKKVYRCAYDGKINCKGNVVHCDEVFIQYYAPALGHKTVATKENVVASTCTTEGSYYQVETCTVCNQVVSRYKVDTPVLEHFGGNATCTKLAVCEGCGEEYGELRGHIEADYLVIDEKNGTHYYPCIYCGDPALEPEEHIYDEENSEQICTACGYVYAPICSVVIESTTDKMTCIRKLRSLDNTLTLSQANAMVQNTPCIAFDNLTYSKATELAEQLESVATVSINTVKPTNYASYDIKTKTISNIQYDFDLDFVDNYLVQSSMFDYEVDDSTLNIYCYGELVQTCSLEKAEPADISALGDIDLNGVIDNNDYAMLVAYVQCNISFTDEQKAVSDLNGDTAVDAFDVIVLDLYLNGVCDIEGNYL